MLRQYVLLLQDIYNYYPTDVTYNLIFVSSLSHKLHDDKMFVSTNFTHTH